MRPGATKACGGKGIPAFARPAELIRSAVQVSLMTEHARRSRQPQGTQTFHEIECEMNIDNVKPAFEGKQTTVLVSSCTGAW